jgi:tetratricopeptide (TPR) repeat protein
MDPLSLIINTVDAKILHMAGRNDEAVGRLGMLMELDPDFPEAYEYLKRTYDQLGRYDLSIEARQERRRILGFDAAITPELAAAAAATSVPEYWRMRLAQELVEARAEGFLPFEFAEIYAQAGDAQLALEWLERACRAHDFQMVFARVAPNLESLRDDPRFREMLDGGCGVS